MKIEKIKKLRQLFFSTPSLLENKTEEEFKQFLLQYEIADLQRTAKKEYIKPPKDYFDKIQRYNELRESIGGI